MLIRVPVVFTYSLLILFFCYQDLFSQPSVNSQKVIVGAERMDEYLNDLKGKNIALVVNQTSLVGKKHLADTLLTYGISVKKIFAFHH